MKNLKLFKEFLNEGIEYDVEGIVAMLMDGTQMELEPEDFSDYMLDEFGIMVVEALDLLDEYWALSARDRSKFTAKQWTKWFNKLDLE